MADHVEVLRENTNPLADLSDGSEYKSDSSSECNVGDSCCCCAGSHDIHVDGSFGFVISPTGEPNVGRLEINIKMIDLRVPENLEDCLRDVEWKLGFSLHELRMTIETIGKQTKDGIKRVMEAIEKSDMVTKKSSCNDERCRLVLVLLMVWLLFGLTISMESVTKLVLMMAVVTIMFSIGVFDSHIS